MSKDILYQGTPSLAGCPLFQNIDLRKSSYHFNGHKHMISSPI